MSNESVTVGEVNQAASVENPNNNVEVENANNNIETEENEETDTELKEAEKSSRESEEANAELKEAEKSSTESEESQINELKKKIEELGKKFEEREQELKEREQEAKREKLSYETLEFLREKRLPAGFLEFVLAEDTKATREKIEKLKNVFSEAFAAYVRNRFHCEPTKWKTDELEE